MDDRSRNTAAEGVCKTCGSAAAAGLIFCAKCGAALRAPAHLIQPDIQDDNSGPKAAGSMKRAVVTGVKGLAGMAAVACLFSPLRTGMQLLLFVASIAVLLICHFALTNLDQTYAEKHGSTGYWPKPLDWGGSPTTNGPNEERTTPQSKP
jgi:hypothetical protein